MLGHSLQKPQISNLLAFLEFFISSGLSNRCCWSPTQLDTHTFTYRIYRGDTVCIPCFHILEPSSPTQRQHNKDCSQLVRLKWLPLWSANDTGKGLISPNPSQWFWKWHLKIYFAHKENSSHMGWGRHHSFGKANGGYLALGASCVTFWYPLQQVMLCHNVPPPQDRRTQRPKANSRGAATVDLWRCKVLQ